MVNISFIRQVGLYRWAKRYATIQVRKRLLKVDTRITLPTGSAIILPRHSPSATEVYVTDASIDWGSEALFAQYGEPTRDFLDVGAHIGYYSNYIAPRVRFVFAFEPDSRNIPALRANAGLVGNVEVIEKAVSSREGVACLHTGSGPALNTLEPVGGPSVDVFVTTIDAFVAERPTVNVGLIKTDAEGHDLEVLRGAYETVKRDQPLILTECQYSGDLATLLAAWGYTPYAFTCERTTMAITFERLSSAMPEGLWYKMLFLVPPRLGAAFAKLARQAPIGH